MSNLPELESFTRRVFPGTEISVLSGGSINNMLNVKKGGVEFVVRGYPYEFKNKLKTEISILTKCFSLGLKTPEIVAMYEPSFEYNAPILILKKIPGETLDKVEGADVVNLLQEVDEILNTVYRDVSIQGHIGYLHEPSFQGSLKDFIKTKAKSYFERINENSLLGDRLSSECKEAISGCLHKIDDHKLGLIYSDLSPKNILVADNKLSGIIDWEFIQGGIFPMTYSNLVLSTVSNPRQQQQVNSFLDNTYPKDINLIKSLAILRGIELLSYIPNSLIYTSIQKKRKIDIKTSELSLIISTLNKNGK